MEGLFYPVKISPQGNMVRPRPLQKVLQVEKPFRTTGHRVFADKIRIKSEPNHSFFCRNRPYLFCGQIPGMRAQVVDIGMGNKRRLPAEKNCLPKTFGGKMR